MKQNTFLALLLSGFFLLNLLSCGSPETSSDGGDTTGITDDAILIGSWGPLTGPAALWGSIMKGMDAHFKMINEEGGVHGRNINFLFEDDGYDPSKTVPVVRELVQKDEIFAAAGGLGTATNMAVFDFLKENNVPWITPYSGATHWTYPVQENIYTSFPLYFDEGDIQIKYAVGELKTEKVAIIYQNDDFGKSGLVGAKYTLQQNNLDFVAALPVEITDTDLSSHAARLKSAGADVVLLWVLPRQAAIILNNCSVIDFKPQWITSFALSDMGLMHNITKGGWEGVIFNSITGYSPYDNSHALVNKYASAFKKHYPEDRWGIFPLGGFIWSELLIEGLNRSGRDLTREKLLESLASIQDWVGVSELPISFSAGNHLGSRTLFMAKCKSATEMEFLSGPIVGSADIQELEKMLEEM